MERDRRALGSTTGRGSPIRRGRWSLEQAAVGPGTRFLDMGCGTGEFCALAAERGATVSGIDAAEGMIERARGRLPDADLRVGAIENLPWDDDSFDVVTGFNSFQFAAERLDGFREARRVARPGGLVAVCVWGPRENNDLQGLFDAVRALARPTTEARPRRSGARRSATRACSRAWPATPGSPCWRPARSTCRTRRADSRQLQGALEFDLITSGIAATVDRDAFREAVERPRRRGAGATTAPTASTTRSAGCSRRPERRQSTSRRTIATVPTITISTRSARGRQPPAVAGAEHPADDRAGGDQAGDPPVDRGGEDEDQARR